MPTIGETVRYTSVSGMRFDAIVRQIHPNGRLDLEVDAGSSKPVALADIEWIAEQNFATRGTAGPKPPA